MSKKKIEALLFVAKEVLSIDTIANLLEEDKSTVTRWIFELQNEYSNKGIIIKQVAGGFEMVSSPDCYDVISPLVPSVYEENVSRSMMETIAIVAYNQGISRSEIGKIRKVANPDWGIQLATEKKLIENKEEKFFTTNEFLKFMKINDLKELPEGKKIEKEKVDEKVYDSIGESDETQEESLKSKKFTPFTL